MHHAGYFSTARTAALAFDRKARELGVVEELLNFPHGRPRGDSAPPDDAEMPAQQRAKRPAKLARDAAPLEEQARRAAAALDAAAAKEERCQRFIEQLERSLEGPLTAACLPRLRSLLAEEGGAARLREAVEAEARAAAVLGGLSE